VPKDEKEKERENNNPITPVGAQIAKTENERL
jgi:hypothetical protein